MTRSVLRPIRTRRIAHISNLPKSETTPTTTITPGTRKTLAAIGALWVSFAVSASVSTASANQVPSAQANASATAPASETLVTRGRDIARSEKGEFDRSRWLLGSARSFQPTVSMPWSPAAAPIAGLPSRTEAQGIVFLTTGKRPDGSMPRPPMPENGLNKADATSVIAYLKSLSK